MCELVNKLFDILDAIEPYEITDNEYNINQAYNDIENNPKEVINHLLDLIDTLI